MPKTDIHVKLIGTDGNAFAILGKVKQALVQAGHVELAEQFIKEVTAGDYDHLLQICLEYVEIE